MDEKPERIEDHPKYFVNPALNPTRKWDDTPDVRAELCHLVSGTPDKRVSLLRTLAERDEHHMTSNDADNARFLNRVAEAFGFVDIIDIRGSTCALAGEAAAALRKVLADDYRYGD